jgi:hypothetical protein
MRNVFIPKSDNMRPRQPPTKHGGFEALFIKDYADEEASMQSGAARASAEFQRSRYNSSMNQTASTTGYLGAQLRESR